MVLREVVSEEREGAVLHRREGGKEVVGAHMLV
jgi:hypothetical protein